MKLNSKILTTALLLGALLLPATAMAKKKSDAKPFYTSKSYVVGVSGDVDSLSVAGFREKIFSNPVQIDCSLPDPAEKEEFTDDQIAEVQKCLNDQKVGKKVLDYLYRFDGKNLSEELLQKRALANAKRADIEYAQGLTEQEALANVYLQENIVPILDNNYIYLQKYYGGKIVYMIFKVDMGLQTFQDVMANWQKPEVYNSLDIPVVFAGSGVGSAEDEYADLQKSISTTVPAFAIQGVLLQRNPAIADFGSQQGARKGDLVSIYRQYTNDEGISYSKRISRARIGKVDEDRSQLFFIAGNKGNKTLGDMAVVTRDSKSALTVQANWMKHIWGAHLAYDYIAAVTNAGFVVRAGIDVDFNVTDKPGRTFTDMSGEEYKAPWILDVTIGASIARTFFGWFEVAPFARVGYEYGYMANKKTFSTSDESTSYSNITAGSIRVPVGIDLAFNTPYPLQVVLTGGYNFNFGLNDENNPYKSFDTLKAVYEHMDIDRNGLFLRAGLRFNF